MKRSRYKCCYLIFNDTRTVWEFILKKNDKQFFRIICAGKQYFLISTLLCDNTATTSLVLIKTGLLSDVSSQFWSPRSHLLPTRPRGDSSQAGRQLWRLNVIPAAQFGPVNAQSLDLTSIGHKKRAKLSPDEGDPGVFQGLSMFCLLPGTKDLSMFPSYD